MIYLDNAATTYPKPWCVLKAVTQYMAECGGNPGRGSHTISIRAAECVYDAREVVAELLSVDDPAKVVFTMNTTYALNTAIKSVISPGDHLLMGNMEHNSVRRPIGHLVDLGLIEYDIFDVRGDAALVTKRLSSLVRPNTRAVVCAHASNICNITAPIYEIGEFCRQQGIVFIVDAAQSAGIVELDLSKMHIDFLCAPGHKGLYGPQGCGIMVVNLSNPLHLTTLVEGGSGIHSLDKDMPADLPEHFEAGTLPAPAIAGLCAGIRWVNSMGVHEICRHEVSLWRRAYSDLSVMRGVRVYDKTPGAILLFNVDGFTPAYVAAELNRAGICVRAGLHCSPMGHSALNTGNDGAVRISFGAMNTVEEVKTFAAELYRITHK